MDGRQGSNGTLEGGRRHGTRVLVWYLTTGAVLAVTRVGLLVWLVHRATWDTRTETDSFIWHWLYPEGFVSVFWSSLVAFYGTKYYLAWGPLVAAGSFVMATPILLVGWLTRERTTSRPSR